MGWNSQENPARRVLGNAEPTPENYARAIRELIDHAEEALKVYGAETAKQVEENATALASDRFIAYSTWVWSNLSEQTGNKPVFRYYYSHPRPVMRREMGNAVAGLAGGVIRGPDAGTTAAPPANGAVHSAEIEYALGNLATNKVYAWTDEDYEVSRTMEEYFANFIKTGDPNGSKLPKWPAANSDKSVPVMNIDVETRMGPEKHRERYEFLDKLNHLTSVKSAMSKRREGMTVVPTRLLLFTRNPERIEWPPVTSVYFPYCLAALPTMDRPWQVLRVHDRPQRDFCVEREKPGLSDRGNLRCVLHVEHDGAGPLAVIVREEIGRFRFEIGQDSLDRGTQGSILGRGISGLHGNRYSQQHSHMVFLL